MITAIGNVMRKCHENGWITTRDGNCSLRRTNETKIYITPTGWRKTIIEPEHMTKIWLSDGNIPKEASIEAGMHINILSPAKKTRAVLHVHATHIVAAMYAGIDLQKLCEDFPELHRYTRVGPSVGVHAPGAFLLAQETAACLGVNPDGSTDYDIVGQDRHGVTALASNPWAAYEHIERLNHICEIALLAGKAK